jgi:hypothetical protein
MRLLIGLAWVPFFVACSSSGDGTSGSGNDSAVGGDSIVEDSANAIDTSSGSDAPHDVASESTAETSSETAGDGGSDLVSQIAGQWHGKIGAGYKNGCLCLTLDAKGKVIAPSGITAGFGVTSGGGTTDTTVVDATGRVVTIHMLVTGAGFSIDHATIAPDASTMSGQWKGDTPSAFDDTIDLDRLPATCKDRTGLDGAPC